MNNLTSSLVSGLNEQQQRAVTAQNHHLLVLAGAGSGKTRVLTHRLAWLLANNQAKPQNLMAVTFTNKAAKEMVMRIQNLPGFNNFSYQRFRQMWLGTFHGNCVRFLRAHFKEANLIESFQIIDTSDQLAVVKRVAEKMQINLDEHPPRDFQYFINARKEEGLRAGQGQIFDVDFELKDNFFREYDKYCQAENLTDFPELLLRTFEVLQRNQILREHYQQRFTHILVDEFQDTNLLQYSLIKLLCGEQGTIFAVGDDDQSIYGFRGARVENIRDFEKKYALNNVIRLEQSYRSTSVILSAANALISNNTQRLGKTLWTEQKAGEPIIIFPGYDDVEEAKWIFSRMQEFSSQGIAWSEMAILYRINAHSRAFEHQAIQSGIPYRIYGGFRFYDRAEIRNILSFLRLLVNPDDETSFLRIVNFPPRAIGDRSIEQLKTISANNGVSLMQAIANLDDAGVRGARALQNFGIMINNLREEIAEFSLVETIKHVVLKTGISDFYQKQRDGSERLENIEELENAANQYLTEKYNDEINNENINDDKNSENDTLENKGLAVVNRFLADAVLDAAEPDSSDKSAVNMMSVHAAKGLEFTVVFIAGLEHGTFPHEFNENIEEERRLMYVAITRAKKYLRMSYAHQRMLHGKYRNNIPSLFINELPSELIQVSGQNINSRGSNISPNNSYTQSQNQIGNNSNFGKSFTDRDSKNSNSQTNNLAKLANNFANHQSTIITQPYPIGTKVRHQKFGEGYVQKYEGHGDDARVLISFGTLGQKWLLVNLAKLEKR